MVEVLGLTERSVELPIVGVAEHLAWHVSIWEAVALAAAAAIAGGLAGIFLRRWLRDSDEVEEQRVLLVEETAELNRANDELTAIVVERRRVEDRLRNSEEKYRTLIEHANDAIVIIQDNAIKFANPKTWEILGYTPEQLKNLPFTEVIAEEDRAMVVERYWRRQQGEDVPSRYSFRTVQQNGGRLWVEINSVVVNWDGRRATLCFLRDMSEQRRAQEALQASEERLQAILDNSTAVVYLKDLEGRYLLVNRLFERLFNVSREKMIGKTDFDLWSRDLATAFRENDQQVLRTGQPLQVEEHAPHADGLHTYLSNKFLLRDAEGRAVALCGISADISDRIQAEAELRASEGRNRAILEATPDQLFVVDRQGTCLQAKVNPEYVSLSSEDLVGKNVTDFFSGELSERFLSAIERTLSSDAMQTFEVRLPTPQGLRHLEMRMVVYPGEACLVIVRDVTDRKRTEAELQDAKQAAESANRAKSQFLANMSHELRTPMNAIIGLTDLAMAGESPPGQRRYLDGILHAAEFMVSMIDTVLDFSKIEAGKLELDTVVFSLRDDLADVISTLAVRAHSKDLELVLDIEPDVPVTVVGDSGRLRQIVFNLVGNAIKFTDAGEVVIAVGVANAQGDRVRLRFEVSDTGIGIAPEKQRLIFEPFRQADGSTTRKYGGTGLGLAICTQLIELMEGTIELQSEPGTGSTFSFEIPFVRSASPEGSTVPAAVEALAGERVLVIDPHHTSRRMWGKLLRSWQFNVAAVGDGDAAIQSLTQSARDLVIVDMQLPIAERQRLVELGGERPEIARAWLLLQRSDARQAPLPSAWVDAAEMTKPVKHSDLAATLVRLLRATGAKETGTERNPRGWGVTAHPMRVLVTEDNPINQRVATSMLEARGHRVEVADNGLQAVDLWQRQPFDVVLMDLQMPGMGGLEATARIRELEPAVGRRSAIVAMTAHALAGDREQCLAAGMDDYLSKPFRAHELFALVERFALPGLVQDPRPLSQSGDALETNGASPFDPAAVLATFGGDEALLREVTGLLLEQCPQQLGQLQQAIDTGQAAEVRRAAHMLKNSWSHFGLERAFDLARQLENMGREGDLAQAAKVAEALASEWQRVRPSLMAYWKSPAEAGRS
jgi:PAS domain S-box-containing protein